MFKQTKKQDVYKVAANQILNWHIYTKKMYISRSQKAKSHTSLIIVAISPGSLLFACIVIHIKSHFIHGIIIHHTNVKALSSYWLTQHIFENIFISCIKKTNLSNYARF